MKKIHRVLALLMAALMAFGLMTTAFAAEPTIDPAKKASLSIYKYDITKASADGVWDAESYVSTGLHDDAVIDKLSKYAIQGVEFTYLRVADIAMNNEVVDGQRQVGVLYGFDNSESSSAVLSAIGLTAADAHKTENGVNYFTSDSLNNKLAAAVVANATTVKNALEVVVKNGGVAMTETDATGHTSASDMEQGLYLVVETRVPENVTSTCNPFFVSLPMTTIDGSEWLYDLTVYPKNQTGNPDLEKTVREDKNSTGKNTGSLTDIKDGYAHTATASVGDVVDYQILSTLPTITSKASSLSEYTYVDTLSKGIKYNKNDVVIEFFKDAGCTDKITTWAEDSGKFTVAYILRNERYIGDAQLQKKYTTDTLPRKRIRNSGEHDSYYVIGIHDAIIPQDWFERVQKLLKSREKTVSVEKTPFHGRVQCSCGAACRSKRSASARYWLCIRHDGDEDACPITQIPEVQIQQAFLRLYYNLKHQGSHILPDLITNLQSIRERKFLWSVDVIELNKQIAELTSQNQLLATLRESGCVDPDIFISKSNKLTEQFRAAKQAKSRILNQDGDDAIPCTQELITILKRGPETLHDFDGELFGQLIDKVIIESNTSLRFRLKNGLELRESIERTVR